MAHREANEQFKCVDMSHYVYHQLRLDVTCKAGPRDKKDELVRKVCALIFLKSDISQHFNFSKLLDRLFFFSSSFRTTSM